MKYTIGTNYISLLFTFILLTPFNSAMAFSAWWQCSGKMGGEWNFARTPSICLVDHMQTQSFVKDQYTQVIFDDTASRTSERKRYMTELNALVKEMGTYYIKRRKPSVSQSEINAFVLGLQTLLHQETYWSHYRQPSDKKVRYMRGDSGHGHGIMQVDDRSHQTALLAGKGADLAYNMVYGLDVFYSNWEKAPSKSCVGSSTNYTARIRAAWAAYNGGPAKLCRWTSTTGTYAHHDKGFYDKLKGKAWNSYITNQNAKTSIDVKCMAEGTRPCGQSGKDDDLVDNPVAGELYRNHYGHYCVVKGSRFDCVDQLNDVNCLQLREGKMYPGADTLSSEGENKYAAVLLDRNQLCMNYVKGMYPIGNSIQLKKSINLRATPGGNLITTLPANSSYQIKDFAVLTTPDQQRYYKVQSGSKTGYVYAGDKDSFLNWAVETDDGSSPSTELAKIHQKIQIVAPYGINLRANIDGTLLKLVPKNTIVKVEDVLIRGSKNYVYYKVTFNGSTGHIYSGFLQSPSTVKDWTVVQAFIDSDKQMAQLADNISYRYLKACASYTCEYSGYSVKSGEKILILSESGDWSKVSSLDGNNKGYIKTNDLVYVP